MVPLLIGFADPFDMALGREPRPDEGFQSFAAGLLHGARDDPLGRRIVLFPGQT